MKDNKIDRNLYLSVKYRGERGKKLMRRVKKLHGRVDH